MENWKRNRKSLSLLCLIGVILILSFSFNQNQTTLEETLSTNITNDSEKFSQPIQSTYWSNFTFIHIDDNWTNGVNWGWINGNGTWGNPYIIENMTIDASSSPTGSGIYIDGNNSYFEIRNCTIYNSGEGLFDAGIYFLNAHNGTISDCKIYDSQYGIHLRFSENATIINNIIENQTEHGIYLNSQNHLTNIVSNNVSDTGDDGIYIKTSDNCYISKSRIYNSSDSGINSSFLFGRR